MAIETQRFMFIADALNASGGFTPQILYTQDAQGMHRPEAVIGPCYLVPHPRESTKKYAARASVAVYENHLRSACERFVGYLAKRPPMRNAVEGPLAQQFIADADWRGNALDVFWQGFAIEAKARGTMLLLVDMPQQTPATLAEQVERRALPYLEAIAPERVTGYAMNERGLFDWVEISAQQTIAGELRNVIRRWDTVGWHVRLDDLVIEQGEHGLGQCPVLVFSEAGSFPHVGSYEQVAQLSRRVYNLRSELDELLRGQTFSVLTYQVTPESAATFSGDRIVAELGSNNMLVHSGDTPEFISPDTGNVEAYLKSLDRYEAALRRLSMTVEEPDKASAESGVALRIRFEALNATLSKFARRMEDLERRTWSLFARAVRQQDRASVAWAKDFSMADVRGEIDTLTAMQATGFPDEVLRQKRKQIVAADFPSLDDREKAELLKAIDEAQAEVTA